MNVAPPTKKSREPQTKTIEKETTINLTLKLSITTQSKTTSRNKVQSKGTTRTRASNRKQSQPSTSRTVTSAQHQAHVPHRGHQNQSGTFYAWNQEGTARIIGPVRNVGTSKRSTPPKAIRTHHYKQSLWCNEEVDYSDDWPWAAWPPNTQYNLLWARESDGPCLECEQQARALENNADGTHCNCSVENWRDECWQAFGQHIYLRHVSPSIGVGAHTSIFIHAGEILGDYLGDLIPHQYFVGESRYCYSIFGEVEGANPDEERELLGYIDASKRGNWLRFLNHVCEDANVLVREMRVGRVRVIAAMAQRNVQPGEELRIDYGDDYFNGTGVGGRTIRCRCGHPNCRF